MWLKGAMALIQHCLLLLLLLEALRARAAWAAPWQEQEAGEMTLHNYPAAWREHGFEDLGHPGMPSKPGEDHQSKINRAYEPGSDDVIERTTELYNPPSPPTVSSPRDPGKLYTIGAVAAVLSLQVAIVLGCVVVWWRRKKKAPVAGASADQLENGSCPSRPDSQCSCPSRPDSQCSCPSHPDSQCSCPSRPGSQCSCPSRPDSQCSCPSRPDSQCSGPSCPDRQTSCPSRLGSQCSCPSRPDSQSSSSSCPDSWTQQEPLPSGRAENQASPRPPCHLSPSPASLQQSRQSSAVQPMTDEHHPLRLPSPFLAPRQQRKQPRTLQHPTKKQRPRRPPSAHPVALERRRQSSSLQPQDQPQSPSHPPSRLPSTLQQQD
ncbi:keratinocyte proline-rich protein-like isoform X1 [Falco cherrug]|uniref:keratinocyte proline-rich protein-like isoform X1 n=1 Tax=Falco cherrug TaxID=345164 RepID=UPI002478ECFB|nr:keratinocyte proline-rich protein-like isoform X1 [Falco cherrug]